MFVLALIFGVCQVLLTERLIMAVGSKNGKKILLFSGAKFLLYALGVGLLVLKYIWYFGMAISGFLAAVPITAIVLFVYKTMYKKQK